MIITSHVNGLTFPHAPCPIVLLLQTKNRLTRIHIEFVSWYGMCVIGPANNCDASRVLQPYVRSIQISQVKWFHSISRLYLIRSSDTDVFDSDIQIASFSSHALCRLHVIACGYVPTSFKSFSSSLMLVIRVVTTCGSVGRFRRFGAALKMEAVCSSETLICIYTTNRRANTDIFAVIKNQISFFSSYT